MTHERYLTAEQVRKFYNRMGRRQDWQRFYEGRAINRHESAGHTPDHGRTEPGRVGTFFVPTRCDPRFDSAWA